jgi:precorrin-6Y C5,15-methyltransferase (decarboxylating)
VHGTAPQALEDLPEPDVVRIGCPDPAVVAACAARRPERIVAAAGTREAAEAVDRALAEGGYTVERMLLNSAVLDGGWTGQGGAGSYLLSGARR